METSVALIDPAASPARASRAADGCEWIQPTRWGVPRPEGQCGRSRPGPFLYTDAVPPALTANAAAGIAGSCKEVAVSTVWIRVTYAAVIAVLVMFSTIFGIQMVS